MSILDPTWALKLTLLKCEFAVFLDFATTVGPFAYFWVSGAPEIEPTSLQETCLKMHLSKKAKKNALDQLWTIFGSKIGAKRVSKKWLLWGCVAPWGPFGPLWDLWGVLGSSQGASKAQNDPKVTPKGPQSDSKKARK